MANLVKKFFEFIDLFYVPISFRYKKEDSYSTCIGGIFSFILIILITAFGIYYFIPFVNRENYSLYYYTINLNQTEEINLRKSKAALAFGFECSNKANAELYKETSIEDLLELKAKYVFYKNKGKDKKNLAINIHNCNISDFYDDENLIKSISKNRMNELKCLDNLDQIIKNRYQDKHDNFTYYQIDVNAKNDVPNLQIRNFLLDNDCKIELYYIDAKIEVEDYSEPIKPFLNEIFLQLDPDLDLRMNNYFMNEYFESDNELFFPGKSSQKINNLFSRMEQYFLHKTDMEENSYAKIYIRADTKRMEVRRKYQTLMEFFADTFSFWGNLFFICEIIFNAYNRVSLNFFIENELLYFKEKENMHFNISENSRRIHELLKLTKIDNLKNKVYKKEDEEIGTDIFNQYVPITQKKQNTTENEIKNYNPIDNNRNDNNTQENHNSTEDRNINNNDNGNSNKNNNNNNKDNPSINNNDDNKKVLKYIFKEIVFAFMNLISIFKCKCCHCKKSNKEIMSEKGEDIINSKLNIIYYVKNMLFLDVINNMLNEDKKEIYKFLSMPIISSNENEEDKIYQQREKELHYSDEDFLNFYLQIKRITDNTTIESDDMKLLKLSYKQLKKLK